MVTKDYSKSRMRENRTYGSVRGGQSNLIPSTRLRGLWIAAFGGYAYEVSVTGMPFCHICHSKHGDESATSGGFSPFGALRHHLSPAVRGHNKAPYNITLISGSTLSTGCCPTACGGKVVAKPPKGVRFSHARQGGCIVFINWRRSRPPQPSRPQGVSIIPYFIAPMIK